MKPAETVEPKYLSPMLLMGGLAGRRQQSRLVCTVKRNSFCVYVCVLVPPKLLDVRASNHKHDRLSLRGECHKGKSRFLMEKHSFLA